MQLKMALRWAVSIKQCESSPHFENHWRRAIQSLPEEDDERQQRFKFRDDSLACIIGRLMIRQAVRNVLEIPWQSIEIKRREKGKPYLDVGSTNSKKMDFNVSHQGDLIVLASSEGESIGVDVMRIDEDRKIKAVDHIRKMHKLFTPTELNMMLAQNTEREKWTAFYRIWCLKESVLKATGTGLVNDLSTLGFITSDEIHCPGCAITSTKYEDRCIPQDEWLFEESFIGDDHCVAVGRILSHQAPRSTTLQLFQMIPFEQLLVGTSLLNNTVDTAEGFNNYIAKPVKL